MTKEEQLKQEAEEYVCKRNPLVTKEWFIDAFKKYDKGEKVKYLKGCEIAEYEAYLAGAEPREKRIAELEKQLDIVRDERNLFQERSEDILENYYCDHPCKCAELEKENAELKSDNIEWEKASDKWKSLYESTNKQLTKAKDHIKKLLDCLQQDTNDPQTNYYVVKYMTEAEQFLKDSEV